MTSKKRKETNEKTTSNIQALDDEALKGIVGGNGPTFGVTSEGPDWSEDG